MDDARTNAASSAPYRRHALPVRIMHWINVVGTDDPADERAQHLRRLSGTALGAVVVQRQGAGARHHRRAGSGRQHARRHAGLRPPFRHHRMAWVDARAHRRARGARVPVMADDSRQPLARDGAVLASVLRLGAADQRHALLRLFDPVAPPRRATCAPDRNDWRSIGASIRDHLRFRHAAGEAAKRYNVLQKLAYLVVIFVLLPLAIATGLGMSPWVNAMLPGWVDVFGGRQSARTIHFVCAWLARRVRRHPRLPGDHHRLLEQPALDDHRTLPRPGAPP